MTNEIPVRLVGVAIETRAEVLQREAQAAQDQWFDHPNSAEHKERFANALLRWAKETNNTTALAHAKSLLPRN